MPCPFFEPRAITAVPTFQNGRLPLIDEYEGYCHLHPARAAIDPSVRLAGCNCGNRDASCRPLHDHFVDPQNLRPVLRFHLQRYQAGSVQVTCIEEQDFAPVRWSTITFRPGSDVFEPEIDDVCRRAQLLAFCRSYLARFPL